MKFKPLLLLLILPLAGLAAYEGVRLQDANQALTVFRTQELAKVRSLIRHPITGQRDEVSPLVEQVAEDGLITLQEYQWLAGAMVHRFKNVDPRVASSMLDAGYHTALELDNEHQRLERQARLLAWLRR